MISWDMAMVVGVLFFLATVLSMMMTINGVMVLIGGGVAMVVMTMMTTRALSFFLHGNTGPWRRRFKT